MRRLAAALGCAVAAAALGATASTAAPVPTTSALDIANAIAADPTVVTGAEWVSAPAPGAAAIGYDELASFPTGGAATPYAILTTGDASLADQPNTSGSSGRDNGGPSVRGNTDYDVTILKIDLNVPGNANCLVGMDFRFLSEEYPEWVGTRYNDAFIAEVDHSTWTTNGSTITAPDNFAFDPNGNPITINAAGVTSMTAENAGGTTYDGATPLLTAATPISPGHHSLYLSIFDQGDHVYDSAVFLDNLRFGHVGDVAADCKPGADLAKPHNELVGLGDSYSSGFGLGDYFPGTHNDPGPNDCQRSADAFAPLLSDVLGMDLSFHACQGAVTADFYNAREGGSWGESPQLDYLTDDTGLVTFSIGGNDAGFADVLRKCITGWNILPFNTCHDDGDVQQIVDGALARLDDRTPDPANIVPYDTLLKDVRAHTPYASRVQVGYPPLFTAEGSDRTFLPGGRCEGVKKADQRWIVEKTAEMNAVIARNDALNGFIFADPTAAFAGHELCSGGDEWFYGLLSGGRFHPTPAGHEAIAQTIVDALDAHGDLTKLLVGPLQTRVYTFDASGGLKLLSVIIEWPGSDIQLSLTSPSGKTYTRSEPAGAYHANGPTWEQFRIADPEPGQWTATLYGANVKPGGEEATIQVYQQQPPNQRPVGAISLRRDGTKLVLDGSGSHDPDGTIASYDWYVSTGDDDQVYQGATVALDAPTDPESITLVVTDDKGLTDFETVNTVPMDVKPGSDDNPIQPRSKGETPVALLSTASLDATTIDASTLRLGPGGSLATPPHVHAEDVNGDGRPDLMLQFPTQDIGVTAGMTTLCMTGTLPERGRLFQACDRIRVN